MQIPFGNFFSNKVRLVYLTSGLLILGIAVSGFFIRQRIYDDEKERVIHDAEAAVDACVDHTLQVTNQANLILHSVRMVYSATKSVPQTMEFIKGMSIDHALFTDIFIIGADGRFILPRSETAIGLTVTDRDYFQFHRSTPADSLFVSVVEKGRISGKYFFRLSRRITNPDGSFGGVVLVTIDPRMFTQYYQELRLGPQNEAALVGADDWKLRARIPETSPDMWSVPIASPSRTDIAKHPAGILSARSTVDNVDRIYVHRSVGRLRLVMLLGFLEADIFNRSAERQQAMMLLRGLMIVSLMIITMIWARIIRANSQLRIELLERKRSAAERERLVAEMQATLDKVKQLEGILPICSFCKKIRDENGEWQVMEKYIGHHSEVMFSHGFCPDCGMKHYPEYYKGKTPP